ncbi:MAG: hypothetical protein AAFW46_01985 [Pseudomonadota bacterium]
MDLSDLEAVARDFVTSGRIVDLALAVILLEFLWLSARWVRTGRGQPPLDLALNLAAGGCIALALRLWIAEAGWTWVALSLLAALAAHWADLARRDRSAAR